MNDSNALAFEGDLDQWLGGLPSYQRKLLLGLIKAEPSLEKVAEDWLYVGSATDIAPFGGYQGQSLFFQKFLDEMHDLLCAGERYEETRTQLKQHVKNGQVAVVSCVTAVVSPALGAAAPLVAPAAAVLLTVISQVGLNAWCAAQAERRRENPST